MTVPLNGSHSRKAGHGRSSRTRRGRSATEFATWQNTILNSINFSAIATDEIGVIRFFNAGAERMLGYKAREVLGQITPADISDTVELSVRAVVLSCDYGIPVANGLEALLFKASRGLEELGDLTFILKDGSRLATTLSVTALRTGPGPIVGYLFIVTDNTLRKGIEERRLRAEEDTASTANIHSKFLEGIVDKRTEELRISKKMFRELAANIPDALSIRDVSRQSIQYVNPAWQKLIGMHATAGDPLEKIHQAIHPDDLLWVTKERRKMRDTQVSSEYRIVCPDQTVRWVHARTFPIESPPGRGPWVAEIIEDVTERHEAVLQLAHLSRHDALTGLPNRTLLYELLQGALERGKGEKQAVSLLLFDIDNFKEINDTLGHIAGNSSLCEFSTRLSKSVRAGDIVGRLGGDEFAVIVLAPDGAHEIAEIAARIQNSLQPPLIFQKQSIPVTASIGVATYPKDASDLETIVSYAEGALYDAKAGGKDTIRRYSVEMNARTTQKADIEGALRLALGRDEFILHYQPKTQIGSGAWTGVEALIRWNRPGWGLVMPDAFVPVLEEMGLIVPVGAWVIEMACRQIHEWELSGRPIRIAVNVSSRQVHEERFVSQVTDAAWKHCIDPGMLEFEITESALMIHGENTDSVLHKLKALGISISIDDFGTGYSNLAYLKRFPIDTLKIDMGFIRDITTNPDAGAIVVAIIDMAHSLRLKVIAEGVETAEQLQFLGIHGCDEAQGYFVSKPMPADQLPAKHAQAIAHIAKQGPVLQRAGP